jgi:hypothetical protein
MVAVADRKYALMDIRDPFEINWSRVLASPFRGMRRAGQRSGARRTARRVGRPVRRRKFARVGTVAAWWLALMAVSMAWLIVATLA